MLLLLAAVLLQSRLLLLLLLLLLGHCRRCRRSHEIRHRVTTTTADTQTITGLLHKSTTQAQMCEQSGHDVDTVWGGYGEDVDRMYDG